MSSTTIVQSAVFGAYKKPRELTWWLGLVLLLLILGFAISGFVLRWDQATYTPSGGSEARFLRVARRDH